MPVASCRYATPLRAAATPRHCLLDIFIEVTLGRAIAASLATLLTPPNSAPPLG